MPADEDKRKARLLTDLAALASERFQEKYVVGGTVETYALPDEILESALSSARAAGERSAASGFSSAEIIAIRTFVAAVSGVDFDDTAAPNREFLQSENWNVARSAARRLLDQLGFSLQGWEMREGLK
ncbi:MAG TPA: hypothetical protein VH370_23735 [Humisphaera sp.]|nr:hypothetical protein [Humisphaera sp.]